MEHEVKEEIIEIDVREESKVTKIKNSQKYLGVFNFYNDEPNPEYEP